MFNSKNLRSTLVVAAALVPMLVASAADAQRRYPDDRGPRLRLGGEGGVGLVIGDSDGGAFSLTGQLGLQASDLFAIYWRPGLHVIGWAAGNDDVDATAFTSQLGMADFTFAHWFQVGGGAGIDIGGFAVCEDNDCETRSGQVKPAIEGRIGIVIPMPSDRVRWGIPINFSAHSTFLGGERIHVLTVSSGILRF
jgi:hypothetical protein